MARKNLVVSFPNEQAGESIASFHGVYLSADFAKELARNLKDGSRMERYVISQVAAGYRLIGCSLLVHCRLLHVESCFCTFCVRRRIFPIPRGFARPLTPRIFFSFFLSSPHIIVDHATQQVHERAKTLRIVIQHVQHSNRSCWPSSRPQDEVADFLSTREASFLSATSKSVDLSLSA
jgi:hypothetical protein